LASREQGFELSLRFDRIDTGNIFASMPIVAARNLLQDSDEPPEKVGPSGWEWLFRENLQDCEETFQIIFAQMAESTDVFYPW
jgi:hypothetical protein